jgi:molecular chaperone HscB
LDLSQSYFALFELPQQFALDADVLSERYRQLQGLTHPDKYADAGAHQQRVAVQYSAFINQAFNTLKKPLPRALYLLQLAGWDAERVADQKVAGDFLMEQMELREKLESVHDLVEPETVIEHLLAELSADWKQHEVELSQAMDSGEWANAASAVVKMQYLDKLRAETEALEAALLDS